MPDNFKRRHKQLAHQFLALCRSERRPYAPREIAMLSFNVGPNAGLPLTDQIVAAVKRQIGDRSLRPGARLPSIRNFADTHRVSRFTVIEAYDRLVAMGCVESRRAPAFSSPRRPRAQKARSRPLPRSTSTTNSSFGLSAVCWRRETSPRSPADRGSPIRGRTTRASVRLSARLPARMARTSSNTAILLVICRCASIWR